MSLGKQAEVGDQEMAEAEAVAGEHSGGDVPRAADIEMGPDGLDSMDESFLEALPADLRLEMAQAAQSRRNQAQPAMTSDQATAMSQDEQPAGVRAAEGNAAASSEQAAGSYSIEIFKLACLALIEEAASCQA